MRAHTNIAAYKRHLTFGQIQANLMRRSSGERVLVVKGQEADVLLGNKPVGVAPEQRYVPSLRVWRHHWLDANLLVLEAQQLKKKFRLDYMQETFSR